MGFSPGEESRSADVAAQAIEAQPLFGQIRPSRGQVRPCAEQHPQEKSWRMSVVPHKMSDGSGVEKETVAQEKAGLLPRNSRSGTLRTAIHSWATDHDCIDEAPLRSELPPCDPST